MTATAVLILLSAGIVFTAFVLIRIMKYGEVDNSDIFARSVPEVDVAGIVSGIIAEVRFVGGCHGNTQGVAALVKGYTVTEAVERLSGIRCGFKSTSCPDQLATALREYTAQK